MVMHVLQLGPYPPPVGGVSRNMLAIRDELVREGHKYSIVATTKGGQQNKEPNVFHPASAWELIRQVRALDFDVLHLHVGGELTKRVLGLAFVCSILGRKRNVLTVHSGEFPQTKEALSARPFSIRGAIFRRFSRIIAVSEPIADVFHRYGVEGDSVSVIAPYSLEMPDPIVEVPDDLREFCAAHSPLLLSVGGLEKEYDPLVQIEAVGKIRENLPNAGLLIVGDGSMRSEVETAVSASGHAADILIAGNVEHAVTLHLINNADILLRTTLFDGDAISIREGLFLGTPVIATDNGMRPAGVHLIPMNDAESLAAAVDEITKIGPGETKEIARVEDNIARVVRLYEQLVSA